MTEHNANNTIGTGVALFLAGAFIGAGVALLLAPQSGAATRMQLKEYAGRAKESMESAIEEGKKTLETVVAKCEKEAKAFRA